jgi:hypothetical protein
MSREVEIAVAVVVDREISTPKSDLTRDLARDREVQGTSETRGIDRQRVPVRSDIIAPRADQNQTIRAVKRNDIAIDIITVVTNITSIIVMIRQLEMRAAMKEKASGRSQAETTKDMIQAMSKNEPMINYIFHNNKFMLLMQII